MYNQQKPKMTVILWNVLNNFILFLCKVVTFFGIPVTLWYLIQNAFVKFDACKTLVYLAMLFILVVVNSKLNGGE